MTIIKEHDSVAALLALPHIGIDEAGRGCLAGPVVAAATYFAPHFDFSLLPGLDDSKKITEHQRNQLAPLIYQHALAFGIGLSWPLEIDCYNIVNATFRAMSRSVLRLDTCHFHQPLPMKPRCQISFLPDMDSNAEQQQEQMRPLLPPLYIDGNLLLRKEQWLAVATLPTSQWHTAFFPQLTRRCVEAHASCHAGRKDNARERKEKEIILAPDPQTICPLPLPDQIAIIKGDARIPSIAAASILAKTYRDALMQRLDDYFPGYQLGKHKGYATKVHRDAIKALGPCSVHRLTFLKKKTAVNDISLSLPL